MRSTTPRGETDEWLWPISRLVGVLWWSCFFSCASTSPTKQKLLHLPDSAPRYSCRVLQRLIEHCRHQKLRKLLENLLNEARRPDLRLTFDSCCGIPRFGFGEKRKRERERDFYFTAFGVFRRPPWKELSCKLQTALAQAQQQHGFCCRTWCYLWITQLLCKTALCVKRVWTQKNIGFVQTRVLEKAILGKALEKAIFRKVMRVKGVWHKSQWIKYWI